MKHDKRKEGSSQLEGEGSYTATRRYNADLRRAVAKGDTEKLADEARKALEGPEGAELKRAEAAAKRGRPVRRRPGQGA